jgi:hypothetical protein
MPEKGYNKAIRIARATRIELSNIVSYVENLQGFRQLIPIALRHSVKIHL